MPAIPCFGECNIPDGEIYTAPILDSVNGKITYNTKSPYNGKVFNHISLEFKNGKIISCTCDEDNNELEKIFNTDEGARYVGEFSFGLNPLLRIQWETFYMMKKSLVVFILHQELHIWMLLMVIKVIFIGILS